MSESAVMVFAREQWMVLGNGLSMFCLKYLNTHTWVLITLGAQGTVVGFRWWKG